MDRDYDPRLALVEAETRYRLMTADELDKLKATFNEDQEKVMNLKRKIDDDNRDVNMRRKEMLVNEREAKFYQDKMDKLDQFHHRNKLKSDRETVEQLRSELNARQSDLRRLRNCLKEFNGVEPTNEDLKRRIDELKASRESLEMTFVYDSP